MRMDSRSSLKPAYVVVVMICCFTAVKATLASGCTVSGDVNGCWPASPATRHRKVLLMRSATWEKRGFEGIERLKKERETFAGRWKLREVPLGPDPMHHHGNPPKKTRTP